MVHWSKNLKGYVITKFRVKMSYSENEKEFI